MFEPIGYIESVFKTRFGTPRQPLLAKTAKAKLVLNKNLQPELSLEGLSEFSHVWVIFVFHENTNKIFRPKIHPPRLEGKTIGVFATRSPHRPNPIGLSLVKLDKIESNTLYFSGVDLIDGTPVLDIKPYLKHVESVEDATEGWVGNVLTSLFEVEFYPECTQDLRKHGLSESEIDEVKSLVVDVVEKDPRPTIYKQTAEKEFHAVYLDRWNVIFQYKGDKILVTKIEPVP